MKRQFFFILGCILFLNGGLIACNVLSSEATSNVTVESLDKTESIESVTGKSTNVVVEPTTTFIGVANKGADENTEEVKSVTPTAEEAAPTKEIAEWHTFKDPLGIFTLPYPVEGEFIAQPLENALFDYGYSFAGSEGNVAGMAVTFKAMPAPASEEAWLSLANSPDLLIMLENEFGLGGFTEQERHVAEGKQRSILLEGVFGEVQYSRMRFEEQDGIWVLMGIFYPIEETPTWNDKIKKTVDRFTWFPEQFGQILANKEETTPSINIEQAVTPPTKSNVLDAFLFSDILGVFHLSYPTSFTRVQMHKQGYGYTLVTPNEDTTLEVRFAQLATSVTEEEWPNFAESYLQNMGLDVSAGTVTTKESASGQSIIQLEITTEEGHEWARLAESNDMLALLLLTAPSEEWEILSQSNVFQSWQEFVWYPDAVDAFFTAQTNLTRYTDPAGIFTLEHPPEFDYAYEDEESSEQIGADYSTTLSDASQLDTNSDILELAVTLKDEEEAPNETVTMLADPEDPTWSWTGEPNSQRGYRYIDAGEVIILSLSEASADDLFTATWIVSRETWQIEKAALMASLQSIYWSADVAHEMGE